MNDVVVTGSRGFIGKRLIEILMNRGIEFRKIEDLDLFVDDEWLRNNDFLDGPYHVYHLAAMTGVTQSWENTQDVFDSNVKGTQRILEFCRITRSSLVFLSSASYAPIKYGDALTEEHILQANNPYALSKILGENLCKFYSEHFNFPITILRLFNVYGPGQSTRFLIPHLISEIEKNGKIVVENLDTKRDYVYIDDVIDAIIKSSEDTNGHVIFNVGSGVTHSVSEVIETMWGILGEKCEVVNRSERRKNQISYSRANIEKIRTHLAWEPQVSLVDGLGRIISFSGSKGSTE